jgi:hypothetical protein
MDSFPTNQYTVVALFKDGTRYEAARYVSESEIENTLNKLRRKHEYRYARFEYFTETEEDNDEGETF